MGELHCWACKTDLDPDDERCGKCGEGIVCPSCGKCKCDFEDTADAPSDPQIIRELFERLIDEAEEIDLAGAPDQEPIEREVLAALIQQSGILGTATPRLILDRATPDYFQTQPLQEIAKTVFPIARSGQPLTAPALKALLADAKLHALVDDLFAATYDVAVFNIYLDVMENTARRNTALAGLAPVARELLGGQPALDTTIASISEAHRELVKPRGLFSDLKPVRDHWLQYCVQLERNQQERKFLGLDMGFPHLNTICNGLGDGLQVYAGMPSVGKTTFVHQIATKVAELNEIPVLFFSYEQSIGELHVKELSRRSRVNNRAILKGKLSSDFECWKKVQQAAAEFFTVSENTYIVEANAQDTVDRIRSCAERIAFQHGTAKCAVFIDYLQKVPLPSGTSYSQKRDEIGFLCSELRRMSRDLKIPVVVISSESRAAYNHKGLDVFKESGEIEYSADVAGILYVDKKRSEELADKKKSARAVDLFIVKNRNGELARIQYTFHPEFSLFTESQCEHLRYHEMVEGHKQ
jgi:replicative DNA helicase